jgi:predicted secreted hydrolase
MGAAGHGRSARPASEAWRLSGRVAAADGRAFDYTVAFFRFPLAHGRTLYPASLSIVDERRRIRFEDRRTEREGFGLAAAAKDRLAVRVGDWSLRQTGARAALPAFDLRVRAPGVSLELHGVALKPRIAFDRDGTGLEQFDYTSIASSGTVTLGSEHVAVSGKSWLDRESGDDVTVKPGSRAARYRVALDDGREILIETDAQERSAILIRRDGRVETLSPGQYEFGNDGGTTWRSIHDAANYPDLWALHVDGQTEFLSLEPVMIDQESVAHGEGAPFWDGAVDVYDVTPGSQGRRLGSGYVLLTGYVAPSGKDAAAR